MIVQRVLPHYRVPFFELLRHELAAEGVSLRLLTGQPTPSEASKQDGGSLSWAEIIRNRYFRLGKRGLVWQPILRSVRSADLVVVEQASRLLVNYALYLWRGAGGPKVAAWGHGANLDSEMASLPGEWLKRQLINVPDWWFCYTEGASERLLREGVPRSKITVVQNATDTAGLCRLKAGVSTADLRRARTELAIGAGPVGIVLGSIYDRKRPKFLIDSAEIIRTLVDDFELIVIGDGPAKHVIDAAAAEHSWIHPVGSVTGEKLATLAALGSVVLNPGLVGLSILDSFALDLPVAACDLSYHSPEIEYLRDGHNGIILRADADPEEFGGQVASVLMNPTLHNALRAGASESARKYTIEEMASRFASGLLAALR